MLKANTKKCIKCQHERILWSKGMCKSCASSNKATLTTTSSSLGNSPLKSKGLIQKTKGGKSPEIKAFYEALQESLKDSARSIETGAAIVGASAVNMAHIFPKESFPSVATDTANIIILTWEEHTRFDELLNRHEFDKLAQEFPNSWGKVCTKVKQLLPKVTEQKPLKFKFEKYLHGL